MPKLTEASLAAHRITFHNTDIRPKTIRAMYVTEDEKTPDMLAFKDHEHQVVALVNKHAVLTIERDDQQAGATGSGFLTTSQVMERAGMNPEDVL